MTCRTERFFQVRRCGKTKIWQPEKAIYPIKLAVNEYMTLSVFKAPFAGGFFIISTNGMLVTPNAQSAASCAKMSILIRGCSHLMNELQPCLQSLPFHRRACQNNADSSVITGINVIPGQPRATLPHPLFSDGGTAISMEKPKP
ncbi:MAG: hypothetical protein QM579_05555 [Desulfovibrio sp.]|uniref:hypothetical protein n=1 Tax=Desulfovibrio sp. TaxID=885 RepID=UPI0039E63980